MALDSPSPIRNANPHDRVVEALAFDDVLVVPAYSQVLPSATDTRLWCRAGSTAANSLTCAGAGRRCFGYHSRYGGP